MLATLPRQLLTLMCGMVFCADLPADECGSACVMRDAANAVVAALEPEQENTARFAFTAPERKDWTYLPWGHHGLPLGDMSPMQQARARVLVDSALSPAGRETLHNIIELEKELYVNTWFKWFRDPQRYALALFGTPGEEPWGWRFGGHHFSLNVTAAGGTFSGTPLFTGANPARVEEGPLAGLRALGREEDEARALFLTLDETQRKQALILDEAPDDILTARDSEISLACCEGLPLSAMTTEQNQRLLALVKLITGRLQEEIAEVRLAAMEQAGLDNLHFAWAGSSQSGEGHYFRIQGPTLLIEYDNTQNDANHAHLVLRDPRYDFGGDLLQQHYAAQPHP